MCEDLQPNSNMSRRQVPVLKVETCEKARSWIEQVHVGCPAPHPFQSISLTLADYLAKTACMIQAIQRCKNDVFNSLASLRTLHIEDRRRADPIFPYPSETVMQGACMPVVKLSVA